MTRTLSRGLAPAFLALCVAAAPAAAQNLLVNAGFDVDLSGWTVLGSQTEVAWHGDDVAGEDGSGSAEVGKAAGEDTVEAALLAQCVPVVGGGHYDLAGFVKEPLGQPVGGRGAIGVRWFPNVACEGFEEIGGAVAAPIEDVPGEWVLAQEETVASTVLAPAEARSALVSVEVSNGQLGEPGEAYRARFDDVRFCPVGTCATLGDEALNLGGEPGLTRYQFRVAFEGGQSATRGVQEPFCLAETACASGAVPGRVEAQLRVIGPRPNGFLWFQVVRFTPSRIVVEAVQFDTATVHYYVLPAVGPGERPTNLEDRTAFPP